jgi:hypothetical protein
MERRTLGIIFYLGDEFEQCRHQETAVSRPRPQQCGRLNNQMNHKVVSLPRHTALHKRRHLLVDLGIDNFLRNRGVDGFQFIFW